MLTYKNLYIQVVEEIQKRIPYRNTDKYGNQLGRGEIAPFLMQGNTLQDVDIAELVEAIQTVLKDALAPWIIEGLNVTETDPISDQIIIELGKGSAGGVLYILSTDTTMTVPFDNTTNIFYVNLYENRVLLEKTRDTSNKLTIAKIVVPQPGTTNRVKNNKEDDFPWDAYIVNFKEYKLYGDKNGYFEEDTVELLRDNISPILADNLIGNIRLSEDLKIINTAGTVELNSKELKLYDTDGNVMAKFDRRGTFFYDSNGRELSRFTSSDARIGNIKVLIDRIQTENFISGSTGFQLKDDGTGFIGGITITSNTLESSNFVAGVLGSGFQITSSGNATFQNIRARGKITTSVFEKDTISSVGGHFMILDSDILNEDMSSIGSTMVISGDTAFEVGDILRIKDGTDDEWLEVAEVTNNTTYLVSRDKGDGYQSGINCPEWKKGTCVVNYGQPGEGGVFMSASDAYSPYINFFTHNGEPWNTIINKTRLGNLDGVPGSGGYGIWGGSGYLGALEVIDRISISSQGSIRSNLTGNYPYMEFSQAGLMLKDSDTGGTYGTAKYGIDTYGYGALAWIMNNTLKIPFAVLKEPNAGAADVADIRFYNRSDNPGGKAEIGDVCVVLGVLKICTGAGTPGVWTAAGSQS